MKPAGTTLRVWRSGMPAPHRLLDALLSFVNEGRMPAYFRPGLYRDARRRIVLYACAKPLVGERYVRRLRSKARRLLVAAASSAEALEATLNGEGVMAALVSPARTRTRPKVRPHAGPGELVPIVRSAADWPSAVLAVALLTPVGRHDVLANRLARCERCGTFHVLPTGRPSRFCGRRCRRAA